MDPTHDIVVIHPPGHPRSRELNLPKPYIPSNNELEPTVSPSTSTPRSIYATESLYDRSLKIKTSYDAIPPKAFTRFRDAVNPYEELKSGSFITRAALKMANMDAIYHFLGNHSPLNEGKVRNDTYRYVSIAEGPGGFIQYIQHRSPYAIGYGITLMDSKHGDHTKWDLKNLDLLKFNIDYKGRVTGDILKEWKQFTDHVLAHGGVMDLVTADGGLDVVTGDNYNKQEQLSSRLIFTEVMMAVILGRPSHMRDRVVYDDLTDRTATVSQIVPGGSAVIKVFDTVTKISADTIYILTKCYDSVSFLKPVTSRPANSERYLICIGRKSNEVCQKWVDIMKNVFSRWEKQDLQSIFGLLPRDYESWLISQNDIHLSTQIQAGENILTLHRGAKIQDLNLPKIDLELCFILWSVPGWTEKEENKPPPVRETPGTKTRRKNYRR